MTANKSYKYGEYGSFEPLLFLLFYETEEHLTFCLLDELRLSSRSCLCDRMKQDRVLLSQDGPHSNVIKFKPPMCFSREDVDSVIQKLDTIFSDVESGKADLSASQAPSNCLNREILVNSHGQEEMDEPYTKRAKLMFGGGIDTKAVSAEWNGNICCLPSVWK